MTAPDERGAARYRAIFHATSVGIALLEAEGSVVEANPALHRMLGYAPGTLQGCLAADLTHADHAESDLRLLRDLLAGRRDPYQVETRLRRRDGSSRWVYVTVSPFHEGERPLALAMIEDITERRVAEEALVQSQHQLVQSQKMEAIGRLASGIAHDFNNMLTAIKGFSSLLQLDLEAEDPLLVYVQEIDRAADRSASLTRQLLTFSRRQVTRPRVLDLNEVVRGMEGMLRRLVGEDVRFALRLAPQGPRIRIDPSQLEQVVLNLVVNARDAMPEGGTVEVVTEPAAGEEGDRVALEVRDTGCGMSREVQERIWEPFFTTKEEGRGTGLGLATVYGIVQQAGGQAEVRSELGRGTSFRLLFPAARGEVDRGEAAPAPRGGADRGATVLLVEDEAVVRELARRILTRAGYRVLATDGGDEALALVEGGERSIDLLLTDVVMPRMSGPELARRLCALLPGTPTLYISGYSLDSLAQRSIAELEAPLLQKPFSMEALEEAVRDALATADRARRR